MLSVAATSTVGALWLISRKFTRSVAWLYTSTTWQGARCPLCPGIP